jgi:hypothetical protein
MTIRSRATPDPIRVLEVFRRSIGPDRGLSRTAGGGRIGSSEPLILHEEMTRLLSSPYIFAAAGRAKHDISNLSDSNLSDEFLAGVGDALYFSPL